MTEVSGTVLFRGEPVEGAVVYIFNTESEEVAAATTDGSGEFSLDAEEATFLTDDNELSQNLQATVEFEEGQKYRPAQWDSESWDNIVWEELFEEDGEIFTELSKPKIVDNE